MANKINTIESLSLKYGKDMSVFYTHKKDKDITALAGYYMRKVHTERLVLVGGAKDKPKASTITKVTILPIKKK
jgi:hypothetical protein